MSLAPEASTVKNALSAAPGVQLRSVQMGRAELDYDPAVTSPEQIKDVVSDAGYDAVPASA